LFARNMNHSICTPGVIEKEPLGTERVKGLSRIIYQLLIF